MPFGWPWGIHEVRYPRTADLPLASNDRLCGLTAAGVKVQRGKAWAITVAGRGPGEGPACWMPAEASAASRRAIVRIGPQRGSHSNTALKVGTQGTPADPVTLPCLGKHSFQSWRMMDQIVSSFAWPLAVVALGLAFIGVFKDPISRFIDRTRSVSRDGVSAFEDPQPAAKAPDALAKFLETYHNPLLLEEEDALKEEIKKLGLTDPTDIQKALSKGLAANRIMRWFEAAQYRVFASQVAALNYLNAQPGPIPKDGLRDFYDKATADFPILHAGRTFDQWFAFLTAQRLVAEGDAGIGISVAGREFLQWRVNQGHSGPWYG